MSAWSIDHISGVTLAVVDMAESVTFYQKLKVSSTFVARPPAPAIR